MTAQEIELIVEKPLMYGLGIDVHVVDGVLAYLRANTALTRCGYSDAMYQPTMAPQSCVTRVNVSCPSASAMPTASADSVTVSYA